ncbi:MAG: tetratricopeptide repeat protein [Planctomycetia bacterium]|nr:tetratricopeptide repeat protein [Planctomycetia bacterium]
MRTVIMLLAVVAADDPKAPAGDTDVKGAPKVTRVADPSYTPQPGDRAVLDTKQKDEDGDPVGAPAAVTVEDFKTYVKLSTENNEDGLDRLEGARKVLYFEAGTEVDVIAISPVLVVGNAQASAGVLCAAVRIAGGSSKGKTLYTLPQFLVNYVAVANPPAAPLAKRKTARGSTKRNAGAAKKDAPDSPAPDPAARAASTLSLGQSLEKAGRTKGAVDLYRQLLKQYPASPQARTAGERIKALEGR